MKIPWVEFASTSHGRSRRRLPDRSAVSMLINPSIVRDRDPEVLGGIAVLGYLRSWTGGGRWR